MFHFPPTSHLCSLWCPSLYVCLSQCFSLCLHDSICFCFYVWFCLWVYVLNVSFCVYVSVYFSVSLLFSICVVLSHLSSIFPLCTPLHLPTSSVSPSSHCSLYLPCSDTSSCLSLWSSWLQRRVLQPHGQGHFPPVESLNPAWLSLSSLIIICLGTCNLPVY